MASVLFSTIGQAVGGPFGAAVGAAVGSSVDSVLFGGRRRGAAELFVQRSAYGDVLPRLYGRSRAAGQLIWALPIAGAGGKGSGRRNKGASFAIALSSGPVKSIGRIWADGREIRNAEGKFESRTVMRVHSGRVGQAADPLIVAAEGVDSAPGYCGLAYVVFEDFDLSRFGNRIPNFSFEVVAGDDGPADWLKDVAGKAEIEVDMVAASRSAEGYAVLDGGMEECGRLSRFGGLSLSFGDGVARFAAVPRVFEIDPDELLAADGVLETVQRNRPAAMALSYLDSERDYQAGRQRVARARRGEELEAGAPITASAGKALTLAGRLLRQAEAAADRIRFGLSWRWLCIAVGDVVHIPGLGHWRIIEREVRGLHLLCEAERAVDGENRPILASDPGRVLPAPVMLAGATDVHLFETPVPLVGDQGALWLWLGGGPGWRGARASLLSAGSEVLIGEVREGAPWGRLAQALEIGPETLWDNRNALFVAVEEGVPAFESRSREDVLAGANLVRIGDELLQYCEAEALAGGIVRLSGLLRGRFGTGKRMRPLEAEETVRFLRPEHLLRIDMPADAIGRPTVVLASGLGDPLGGTEVELVGEGLAAAPLAPVHVRVWRTGDGAISSDWRPRSSKMWAWASEEPAHPNWLWRFHGLDGRSVSIPVDGPEIHLSVAEQVNILGEAFGAGRVLIEAMGDGPTDLRFSLPVDI